MSKPATWTLNPISERDDCEERQSRLAARRSGFLLAWAMSILLPLLSLSREPLVPIAGAIAFLLLVFNFFRRYLRIEERRLEIRRAVLEEFGDAPGWIVDLTIYQGNCPTGRDRGIAWFEQDQLVFSGHRTSFVLAADDAAGRPKFDWQVEDVRSPLTLELKESHSGRPVSLGFNCISSELGEVRLSESLQTFCTGIEGWISKGAKVESQLPPLSLGPDAPSAVQLLHRALLASGYWFLAFGFGAMLAFIPLFCAAILALLLPEVRYPIRRWRAYLDRRHLERSLLIRSGL